MSIRLTWLANPEADIASYELQRSDDAIVFSTIASIAHNLLDPLVYDTSIGRFFYDDATGIAASHYYRMRAIDSSGNQSGWTTTKQAGAPTPPLCTVFGTVVNPDGSPNSDVQVRATIESTKSTKDGQTVGTLGVTGKRIEVFTDDAGFFEVQLLQGASVVLSIPDIELEKTITVPALASADFNTLI